jgi:hypothetical protein
LHGLTFNIKSQTGKILKVRPQLDDRLLIEGVPNEPMEITITSAMSGKKWTAIVFPAFRSASPDLLLYLIRDVTVGNEK